MIDDPIVEEEFLSGVNVVDIGDIRVARGFSRRPSTMCKHRHLTYDQSERRVWCKDCEKGVDPFDAFMMLCEQFSSEASRLERLDQRLKEAETYQVRSLAAKAVDEVWRSRNMVPMCPCCKQGLFPEDFKHGGVGSLGREYAEAQRKRRLGKSHRKGDAG